MPSRPKDLFMRRNGGAQPVSLRRETYGVVSPDIVPVGPVPPPNVAASLMADFEGDPSRRWMVNAINQIYVRGTNASSEDSGYEISVYYAPGETVPWPDLFLNNVVPTSKGVAQAAMPPTRGGARFVSPDAFCLNTPTQSVSLLASVSSRTSPPIKPLAPIRTAEALVQYYDDRPNVAVRSAEVVPVAGAEGWNAAYYFESRDLAGTVKVLIATHRVAVGWTVTLGYLPDGAQEPEVLIPPSKITDLGQSFGVDWPVQPNMYGQFLLSVRTNGVAGNTGWSVSVSLAMVVPVSSALFKTGLMHEDVGLDPAAPGERLAEIGGFAVMASQTDDL